MTQERKDYLFKDKDHLKYQFEGLIDILNKNIKEQIKKSDESTILESNRIDDEENESEENNKKRRKATKTQLPLIFVFPSEYVANLSILLEMNDAERRKDALVKISTILFEKMWFEHEMYVFIYVLFY
jgi:hypothetical protein